MISMERLTSCPNCGAALNETGRCRFCGSIIYDFCNIDVSSKNRQGTYIRVKVDDKVIIAPIMTNCVSLTCDDKSLPTINVEFYVTGDTIVAEKEGDNYEK